MRVNNPRKYIQLKVIHEKFIWGGPAFYVLCVIKCSKNETTITCLPTDFNCGCQLRHYGRDDARNFSCSMQWIYYFQVYAVYMMPVRRDGRSPNPSEKLKLRTVAEPDSNISAVLLQGKGQIKTLTEQGRVTRQRQGWVNFLSKRDDEGCQGFGVLPERWKCIINLSSRKS
jgi:hypothetical protein